jgi:hypothetical protein
MSDRFGDLTGYIDVCDMSHWPGGLFSRRYAEVNRYKTSYRSVIDVICLKIETDGTGVTTLAEAIRHADLTHSRSSDGSRIDAGTIGGHRMRSFSGVLIAYF